MDEKAKPPSTENLKMLTNDVVTFKFTYQKLVTFISVIFNDSVLGEISYQFYLDNSTIFMIS